MLSEYATVQTLDQTSMMWHDDQYLAWNSKFFLILLVNYLRIHLLVHSRTHWIRFHVTRARWNRLAWPWLRCSKKQDQQASGKQLAGILMGFIATIRYLWWLFSFFWTCSMQLSNWGHTNICSVVTLVVLSYLVYFEGLTCLLNQL